MDIVKLIDANRDKKANVELKREVGGGGGAHFLTWRADLFQDETHLAFSSENSKFNLPNLNG